MLVDRKEVEKAYILAEQTRLKLWEMLESPELEPNDNSEPLQDVLINTEIKEKYIKITVGDILPRDVGLSKNLLKFHWLGIMHKALMGVKLNFKKVLCIIRIFNPSYYWDIDNRAYKIILDSLRYNKLIPDDRFDYMSFMVMGETDRTNPRTEIYLLEQPEFPYQFMALQQA